MAVVDDVMKDDTAIGMDCRIHFRHSAERGNDDRHLVFHAKAEIVLKALVGTVHDLVDREGRGWPIRIGLVVSGKSFRDLCQPLIELCFRTGIECGKGTDDACLALRHDQSRMRNDE